MSTDALDQMPDAELSEVFAVEVAGWKRNSCGEWSDAMGRTQYYEFDQYRPIETPKFATSADAVLPFTKGLALVAEDHGAHWSCIAVPLDWAADNVTSTAPTFARAACIALIRAKRAEKGTG